MVLHAALTLALVALLALPPPPALARPASNAVWAADSGITRKQGNGLDANGVPLVSYEHGEFQVRARALLQLLTRFVFALRSGPCASCSNAPGTNRTSTISRRALTILSFRMGLSTSRTSASSVAIGVERC